MGEGRPGGGFDLAPLRVLGTVSDIGGDRVVEQRGVLWNEREARPKLAERNLVDAEPIDLDLSVAGIVEAEQQSEDSGLARTRRPDQGDPFARRRTEAHMIKCACLRPQRIGEGHIAEGDLAARRDGQRFWIGRRLDVGLDPKQLA